MTWTPLTNCLFALTAPCIVSRTFSFPWIPLWSLHWCRKAFNIESFVRLKFSGSSVAPSCWFLCLRIWLLALLRCHLSPYFPSSGWGAGRHEGHLKLWFPPTLLPLPWGRAVVMPDACFAALLAKVYVNKGDYLKTADVIICCVISGLTSVAPSHVWCTHHNSLHIVNSRCWKKIHIAVLVVILQYHATVRKRT